MKISNFGFRPSDFFRVSAFGVRILIAVIAWATPLVAMGAETNGASDLPPPSLHPPRGEILPGFWEQHGTAIILVTILALGLIGVVIWLMLRPKAPVPVQYAALARQELAPLRECPEDGALLSRTSQIVRRYVARTFTLPPNELTTTEFCQAVLEDPKIGKELSKEATEFLRACDFRKFAPSSPGPALGAVDRALCIIDHAETRMRELHQLAAAQAANPSTHRPSNGGQEKGMPSGS